MNLSAFNLQTLVDRMSQQWKRERAETQLTLGKLIAALETMPPDAPITNLLEPHSYRGYYEDLAFEQGEGTRTVGELLADCKAAMGQVFQGYKGGDFVMGALTPVWVASWGDCGKKLIAIGTNGSIETAEDE